MKPEDLAGDIPASLANAAHAGTSFVPDQRGATERAQYAGQLASDYANLSAFATTPEKIETLDREFARYRDGFRKRYVAMLSARSRCVSTMIAGGSNFPVARAEKRNATADKRIAELVEYRKRAIASIRKALTPELQPIMSGDADALTRLDAQIAKAEEAQSLMSAANAAIRKHAKGGPDAQAAALVGLGFSEPRARQLLERDDFGRVGFPSFELSNNGANIRRMKARREQIAASKSAPVESTGGSLARLEDSPANNRVRLFFPGKPDADVRGRLKASGFRWAPSLGCWQAYRNHNAIVTARREAGIVEAE